MAKFEKRKDRNLVLNQARDKLKNNKNFAVYEQFPVEVVERRKNLVPILVDARQKGHNAVLREDKLYIDNKRFIPRGPPPAPQFQVPQ